MKIQHIISTMNREEFSFLEKLCLKTDAVVVNQNCPEGKAKETLRNGVDVNIISTPEKGLSRSRNKLLENATGEVCIIGDDDVEYLDGYLEAVRQAYEKYTDADIIIFRFTHEKGKETRVRYTEDIKVSMQSISKFSSVEITFKRESVLKAGLGFNNNIGLGTAFPSGEENAFLADALRAGLNIYHVPVTICVAREDLKINESYGVQKYLVDKGAVFYCIYKKMFPLYALAFVVLKKKSLFKDVSFFKCFSLMCKGRKKYIKSVKE
ncbi:MAG: glycosyltransferase [Clostridia bacterium]|nr:glycosyltransferase [Clostridia bacterium]